MCQKMSYVVTLCVVLFASQAAMVPVNQGSSAQMSESPATGTEALSKINPSEEEKPSNSEVVTMGHLDQMSGLERLDRHKTESPLMMLQVLSRIKRTVLEDHKCAIGFVRLRGKCITCEEYTERTSRDCPTNNG